MSKSLYIGKSNKAHTDTRNDLFNYIREMYPELQIREFVGGHYSDGPLLSADVFLIVPDYVNKGYIGKGIYNQINSAVAAHIPTYMLSTSVQTSNFTFLKVVGTRINDTKDYIRFGSPILEGETISIDAILSAYSSQPSSSPLTDEDFDDW